MGVRFYRVNMQLKNPRTLLFFFTMLFIISSVSGVLVFTLVPPSGKANVIHIRLIDVTWPPPPELIHIGDTYATFDVPMVFQMWNPSTTTFEYTTGNSNLLDPQMTIELDEDHSYTAGYLFWIFITKHKIEPGITTKDAIMSVTIYHYNDSILPLGMYTIWSGIVGNPELYGNPPFTFKSYQSTINQGYGSFEIEHEITPKNWGKINPAFLPIFLWSCSGVELAAILYVVVKQYKKKHVET